MIIVRCNKACRSSSPYGEFDHRMHTILSIVPMSGLRSASNRRVAVLRMKMFENHTIVTLPVRKTGA